MIRTLVRAAVFWPAVFLCLAASPKAGDLTDRQVLDTLTREQPRDRAIRKGLAWLRSQTRPDGGVGEKHTAAMAALALMAHLGAGVSFDHDEHGPWMRERLETLLARQDESGYFGKADGSRMYGHGIVTLLLAEALGMTRDDDLERRVRRALERALAVTVAAARVKKPPQHAGGWRYEPHSRDSDLSLSGWQLMGLHAARQVGVDVPEAVIDAAVAYAKGNTADDGRVGYQGKGQDSRALRGLGLLCLAIGGEEESPLAGRIVDRIRNDPLRWQGQWLFYRAYYDAVGMSRAAPEAWADYGPGLEAVLVEHQKEDGAWPTPPGNNEGAHGGVYMTSMALLALTVERHVLPAYQR